MGIDENSLPKFEELKMNSILSNFKN